MKTNQEHFKARAQCTLAERGNALVYVLIAVALFAALSFTLSRQTDNGEAGTLTEERAELYAAQLISTAAQAKSAVDQMLFSVGRVNDLIFELPSDGNFEVGSLIHKVHHPQGGGLTPSHLPPGVVAQNGTDPVAGWYLGRFNNVEWTTGAGDDVILVAYQISQAVCEKINEKINGTIVIPTMTNSIKNVMINDALHTGTNVELTTDAGDICPECDQMGSLCVENAAQDAYGFYTVIADQ